MNFKDHLTEYKCLSYIKKLSTRFFNTYSFSNDGNNKFILLL